MVWWWELSDIDSLSTLPKTYWLVCVAYADQTKTWVRDRFVPFDDTYVRLYKPAFPTYTRTAKLTIDIIKAATAS